MLKDLEKATELEVSKAKQEAEQLMVKDMDMSRQLREEFCWDIVVQCQQ